MVQPIEKLSSKNTCWRLDRNVGKTEVDVDEIIRQRKKKLETDPNYQQKDFDADFIRYKILNLAPEKSEKSPEMSSVDAQPNNDNPFGVDDDTSFSFSFRSDYSFPDSNKHISDKSFADDLSEMNFLTDGSRTSFFR